MPADLDSGATILLAVQFGDLQIAAEGLIISTGVPVPGIELTGAMITPTGGDHTFFKSGDRSQQAKEITESHEFNMGIFTCGPDNRVEYKLLNDALRFDADGNREAKKGVLFVQGSQNLVPAADNLVYGFHIPGHRLGPIGGNVGDAMQYDYTTPISGGIEELTSIIAQPTNLVAGNPTSTTIDLTWDADAEVLVEHQGLFRVKSYDVYQSLTTSVGFAKVNTSPVLNNQTGNTFTAIGLTTATAYFFYVIAIGEFGDVSVISAEATDTTL